MKVTGFQVEEHGSGYALTIRVNVGREELADDWVGNLFSRLQAGGDLFGQEEEDHEPTQASGDDEGAAAGVSDSKPASTRGRRRGRRDAVGGASDAPAEGGAESRDAPDVDAAAAPAGRRGRRSRVASEAAEAPAKPVRRRGKKQEDKGDASPPSAPTAGRRSKKKGSSAELAKAAKSPSKDDVSDEDLTKAASQAAASIGAPAVMDILDEFGVDEVRSLNQDQRREFVAKLADA